MATDGDEARAAAEPAVPPAPALQPQVYALNGSVLCLFDGSPEAFPRLRLAAEAAGASSRRLLVAHVESVSTGFWAAAFTGYGACLGPAERLLTSSAEAVFAAAVEALADAPCGWDFTACRGGHRRSLRRLAHLHNAEVVVVPRRTRLVRKLTDDRRFTLLALD